MFLHPLAELDVMKARPVLARLCIVGAVLAAAPASAHHSGGVFDRNSEVRLMGIVKAIEWTNPHAWIEINVPSPAGKTTQWSVELDSPNVLRRHGWQLTDVKAGDRLTIVAHPTRDGRPTAAYISILLPGGKMLGRGAALPPGA